MKIWVDDVRPAPDGYVWCKSVNEAKHRIRQIEHDVSVDSSKYSAINLLDLDHDAGKFAQHGGDYIKLLDWCEQTGRKYPIRIHSMNVVGRQNMLAICERNGWKVVK